MSTGFARIDEEPDPQAYIRLLDRQRARQQVRNWKWRTYKLLRATRGAHVLDVGCGTGEDALELAETVGSEGRVVGVDVSRQAIEEARRRASAAGVTNVAFVVGDAVSLDFADWGFDAVRAERLLLHVKQSRRAMSELVRVCRPGGHVVCLEPDCSTWIVDTPLHDIERRLVDFMNAGIPNPRIGRELRRYFIEAGLTGVLTEPLVDLITDFAEASQLLELVPRPERPLAAGVLSVNEAEKWVEELERAGHKDTFCWAMTWFLVAGRKAATN